METIRTAAELRTGKERALRRIAYGISGLAWTIILVSVVGALYGLLVAGMLSIGRALHLARIRGNGVRIGPRQFPELWIKIVRASHLLGLAEPPPTYVVQAGGALNAFATKLWGRPFVILYSDLVGACERAGGLPTDGTDDARPNEIDFLIGHELGHLMAKHLSWFTLPARVIPVFGPAYSRACEYTADVCGHEVVGDLRVSSRALVILAAGGWKGPQVNLSAFVEQRIEARGFWLSVYELNASHPYLTKRVAALRERLSPGVAPVLGCNPAAYPLAPFLGAAGGLLPLVLIALLFGLGAGGFLAAKKYLESAKVPVADSQ